MAHAFHPVVQSWFSGRFGTPTEPQAQGWPLIASGRDTLITAPTGSGKTLTAFLISLDRLLRQSAGGELGDTTQVVYISPLKALANDVQKNLEQPLTEICAKAAEEGILLAPPRIAVRSGDTPPGERQAMLRRPPHILVTTPESLYILLTGGRSREMLRSVRTVIVDEVHSLCGNKRGAHLALSLERLDALCGCTPQRIGLSATAKPLEAVAGFLAGARPTPAILTVPDRRELDLAVEVPQSELTAVATNEQWEERYQRLSELSAEHQSTLVFVSTRRMSERIAHRMRERLGEDNVAAHHGSLSRRIRLRAEERFKAGKLKMMVATASLELGLDIGAVELVCQIGSPRQLAAAWQRVGRAGHWRGAIPKGRFFATTRDELIECGALVRGLHARTLDSLRIQPWPRDILAQQIVATVATGEWDIEELFAMVKRAWPYHELPREQFDAIVEILSEGISTRRGRRGAMLHRDGVHGKLRPRRGARLAAITSGGAIAETAQYVVEAEPENIVIGSLDEDFAVESNAGDIILLGTHSWKVRGIETGRVRVEDAMGAPPTVPFWLGEAPGRTEELSEEVSRLRDEIATRPNATEWLQTECGMSESGARQADAYVAAATGVLHGVPTTQHLIAERFFNESGDDQAGMQLVIHAPFGSAINKAWGMALRKRFCRGFDFELQAAASENGLVLALSEQHSFPLETIFAFLNSSSVQDVLEQAVLQAPIFPTRWRWTVGRALALLRFVSGRKLAPQLQRMRAEDLLAAAFPMAVGCQDNHGGEDLEIPDHPYVHEAMRDCLHEFLDLDGLKRVLRGLESGEIKFSAIDTPAPSGFSHEILNVGVFGFLDDAPLEERRSKAVDMRRMPPASETPGALDPAAVEAVTAEARPQPETADELHDLMLTLLWLPDTEVAAEWRPFLEELRRDQRVVAGQVGPRSGWMAAERAKAMQPGGEEAFARMVGGWMEILGPTTAAELGHRLGLETDVAESALLALETQGRALRGVFGWCERGLLALVHRRMVRRLRAEIQPVSPAQFYRFLRRWQHTETGTRLHGVSGLQAVLEQLQGYEAAAGAWEQFILPRRVADYAPAMLDQLCLGGEIAWARLQPMSRNGNGTRRVTPNRNSPMTFLRREDASWLLPMAGWRRDACVLLSAEAAQVLDTLERRGASFFTELAGNGLVKSQVEDALWELVAAGRVTADGFDNLRAFLDPKRRAGQGSGHLTRPRHSAGRWALVRTLTDEQDDGSVAPDATEQEARRAVLAERQAKLWLRRYGVIFKALLAREDSALGWYEVLLACRRLEARGEIRGGRFVSGFAGEQYALPEAVEALRMVKRLPEEVTTPEFAPADPLSLSGIIVPGEKAG